MSDDGIRCVFDAGLAIEQPEMEIGVFAPCKAETLVEAAQLFQYFLAAETVGGNEFCGFQIGRIKLVVGRNAG